MELNIKVLDVEVTTKPTKSGKGEYQQAIVSYRDLNSGQTTAQKLFEFNDKDLFAEVVKLEAGDERSVVKEKEGEIWQWKQLGKVTAQASKPAKSSGGSKGGYNADARQLSIVRQSCLKAAVQSLKVGSTTDKILDRTEEFLNYVYNGVPATAADGAMDDMEKDPLEDEFDPQVD